MINLKGIVGPRFTLMIPISIFAVGSEDVLELTAVSFHSKNICTGGTAIVWEWMDLLPQLLDSKRVL